MTRETVSIGPPQFPGQEDVECWIVTRADGIDQDCTIEDFVAATKDPEVPVYVEAEGLTRDVAAVLAARLTRDNPDRRYFVLPVKLGKLS